MYADKITGSMERAIKETDRRRQKQTAYNKKYGITPATIQKNVQDVLEGSFKGDTDQSRVTATLETPIKAGSNYDKHIGQLRKDMFLAAENLEFEEAGRLRDEISRLEKVNLAITENPLIRQTDVISKSSENLTSGRSKAGRGGTRSFRGKSMKKF